MSVMRKGLSILLSGLDSSLRLPCLMRSFESSLTTIDTMRKPRLPPASPKDCCRGDGQSSRPAKNIPYFMTVAVVITLAALIGPSVRPAAAYEYHRHLHVLLSFFKLK
jgi:hypothetical protein